MSEMIPPSFKKFAIAVSLLSGIAMLVIGIAISSASESPATIQVKTSLGVWFNMPSLATELMGNSSYRGLVVTRSSSGESGIQVGLSVGCINPSNTVGATLQLQYANYSDTTHVNATNFVNIGSPVFIDNSANWPCPGNPEAIGGTFPAINSNPVIFILRAVGSGGGGSGDNPRFSSVNVYAIQSTTRIVSTVVSSRTTTSFTAFVYTTYPLTATTTENFDWIASNSTALVGTDTQHGSNSCSITAGLSSCSVSTTFATPFIGTPSVVLTSRNPAVTISIPLGSLNLLQAQTLTV
jgi:hypothetical protein